MGAPLSRSLEKSQEITVVSIPFPSLVLFVVIATFLGLAAASWPARQAGKLDLLAAIAPE